MRYVVERLLGVTMSISPLTRPLKSHAGLTFIEVLVSITLVTIVSVSITSSMTQVAKLQKNVEAKDLSEFAPNQMLSLLSNKVICKKNLRRRINGLSNPLAVFDSDSTRSNVFNLSISPANRNSSISDPDLDRSIVYKAGTKIGDYTISELSVKYKTNATQNVALMDLQIQFKDENDRLFPKKSFPLWVEWDKDTGALLNCSTNTADAYMGTKSIDENLCQSLGPQVYGVTTNYLGEPVTFYLDSDGYCRYDDGLTWDWYDDLVDGNYPAPSNDVANPLISTATCPADSVGYSDWCYAEYDREAYCPVPRTPDGACVFNRAPEPPSTEPFGGEPKPFACRTSEENNRFKASCTWAPGVTGKCMIWCGRPRSSTTASM